MVSSPRGSKATVEPCDEGARSPIPATASDIASDAAGDASGGAAGAAVTQGTIEVFGVTMLMIGSLINFL